MVNDGFRWKLVISGDKLMFQIQCECKHIQTINQTLQRNLILSTYLTVV